MALTSPLNTAVAKLSTDFDAFVAAPDATVSEINAATDAVNAVDSKVLAAIRYQQLKKQGDIKREVCKPNLLPKEID